MSPTDPNSPPPSPIVQSIEKKSSTPSMFTLAGFSPSSIKLYKEDKHKRTPTPLPQRQTTVISPVNNDKIGKTRHSLLGGEGKSSPHSDPELLTGLSDSELLTKLHDE